MLVKGLKPALFAEDEAGCVLALVHAPVVIHPEGAMDGAEAAGKQIEFAVPPLDLQAVGDLVCAVPIAESGEGVVEHREADALWAQLGGQPVRALEVDLQAARQPGGRAHIT